MKSLDSQSDLSLDPPYGSNWGHKIADLGFLPYISLLQKYMAHTKLVNLSLHIILISQCMESWYKFGVILLFHRLSLCWFEPDKFYVKYKLLNIDAYLYA